MHLSQQCSTVLSMRVATWNMKQVAPKRPLAERWAWMEEQIGADIVVLTEAKVPDEGPPTGWSAIWTPGGVGKRRRWGTVVAGRGVDLVEVTEVPRRLRQPLPLRFEWPAVVHAADVHIEGERWGTVIGLYGITLGPDGESIGSGAYSVGVLMEQIDPLLRSRRDERVLVAGDFNLVPSTMTGLADDYGLVDLVEATADTRPPLEGCTGCSTGSACGHLWTHRNTDNPGAKAQNIDYLLASPRLAGEATSVFGGIGDFPDAWDVSDHAPVVADFSNRC